jgi:hypothetical protein
MVKSRIVLAMILGLSLLSWLRCAVSGSSAPSSTSMEPPEMRDAAYAQYPDALYPIIKGDKWGYMNRRGDIVIAPAFVAAEDFHDGRAIIAIDSNGSQLYGYIDSKGAWVVNPKYHRANRFAENRAAVSLNDQWGYIDSTGKEIIALQFADAGSFNEGIAAVKHNGWTGFIDTTGTIIIEPRFMCTVSHPVFVDGIAPAFGADEQTGYIDKQGNWVIEPKFHSASKFTEGKAWAMTQFDDPDAQHGFRIRGGFINREGDYIIQPEYDFGWDFYEGHATVWKRSDDRMKKLWSVIDSTGNRILSDLTYRNVGAITDGLIPVQNEDMAWGFINLKGEIIIEPQYTGINRFKNGLARMETGSAFSPRPIYINTLGQVVWNE